MPAQHALADGTNAREPRAGKPQSLARATAHASVRALLRALSSSDLADGASPAAAAVSAGLRAPPRGGRPFAATAVDSPPVDGNSFGPAPAPRPGRRWPSEAGTQTEAAAAASPTTPGSGRGLLWRALIGGERTPSSSPAAAAARAAAEAAAADRARSAADRAAAAAAAVVGEDVPAAALPPAWRPAGVEGSSPGAAEVLLPPPSPTAAPAEMPPPPPRAPPALTPPPHLSTIAERAAAGDLAVTLDDVRAAAAAAAASAAALAPAPRPASTAGSGWTLATAQSAGAERTQWWAGGEGGGFAAALRVAPDGRVWRKRGAKARSGGWLGAWLG